MNSGVVVGSAAYVSGDRQREGIFPLWSIAWNVTIASIRRLARGGFLASAAESGLAESWRQKIGIRSASTALQLATTTDEPGPDAALAGGVTQDRAPQATY